MIAYVLFAFINISSGEECPAGKTKDGCKEGTRDEAGCCWKPKDISSYEKSKETTIVGDGYKAILIPAGTFTMGCTAEQDGCDDDEKPAHQVELTRDFYLMEAEVTQGLYQRVMGNNPSHFKGSDRPVEKVSWYDVMRFANQLSQLEGLEQCYQLNGTNVSWSNKDCKGWRLPTEAEWEWAARGGQPAQYSGSNDADTVAWYLDNSGNQTHDVCLKQKNGYGLCDMSGNVWEWVWDRRGAYGSEPIQDPYGASEGPYRVLRGGSFRNGARLSRVLERNRTIPSSEGSLFGFRLGRTP